MTPFALQALAWIIIVLVLALAFRLFYRFWTWRRSASRTARVPRELKPAAVEPVMESRAHEPAEPTKPVVATAQPAYDYRLIAPPAAQSSATKPVAAADSHRLAKLDPEDFPFSDTRDYSFGPITPLLASLLPETGERRLQTKRDLVNAGYLTPHAYQNLAATRYLGLILPILFFGVLLVIVPAAMEPLMIAGLIVGPGIGWSIPVVLVRGQAAKRLREIEAGMPDMLDLLNMCVSQGMTITAALARVGKELDKVYPALAKELKIVAEQARVSTLEQALSNFSERVDVPEVHSFTALLIQTERLGTSVSRALTDYSDNMRESLRQRADQKANSAAFKLLFPTVMCLMPAVFLFLMGPAIIQLSDFFGGAGAEILGSESPTGEL